VSWAEAGDIVQQERSLSDIHADLNERVLPELFKSFRKVGALAFRLEPADAKVAASWSASICLRTSALGFGKIDHGGKELFEKFVMVGVLAIIEGYVLDMGLIESANEGEVWQRGGTADNLQ